MDLVFVWCIFVCYVYINLMVRRWIIIVIDFIGFYLYVFILINVIWNEYGFFFIILLLNVLKECDYWLMIESIWEILNNVKEIVYCWCILYIGIVKRI